MSASDLHIVQKLFSEFYEMESHVHMYYKTKRMHLGWKDFKELSI